MCNPVAVVAAASTAITIGGDIAGYAGQNKAAKANKQAALADLKNQRSDLSVRAIEDKQAAAQEVTQATLETQAAKGLTNAGASEGGVAGMSIDALINTQDAQLASYKGSVDQNLSSDLAQIDRAKTSAEAQARARISSVQPGNPFLLGLRIAGAGLDYAKYKIGNKPAGT